MFIHRTYTGYYTNVSPNFINVLAAASSNLNSRMRLDKASFISKLAATKAHHTMLELYQKHGYNFIPESPDSKDTFTLQFDEHAEGLQRTYTLRFVTRSKTYTEKPFYYIRSTISKHGGTVFKAYPYPREVR